MTDFWERLARAPLREPLHIATDPDGVEVFLSREVWETHILIRHDVLLEYRSYLTQAITNPDQRVWEEPDSEGRYFIIHYAHIPAALPSSPASRRIRVVVKYLKPKTRQYKLTALVCTAYLLSWRGE